MNIYIKKFFLLFLFLFTFDLISDELKTVNIKKIIIHGKTSLDEHKITNILSEDIVIGLLPYKVPFMHLTVSDKNLNDCSDLISSYLKDRGFYKNKVSCSYKKDKKELIIDAIDNKPVIIRDIKVINDFEDFSLCKNTKICLKDNQKLNRKVIETFKNNVSELLANQGYIFSVVSVEPLFIDDFNVSLEIKIKKNKRVFIGKLTYKIEGDISPNLIENLLEFKNGDLFSYTKIRDSINNLKKKKIFSSIIITPELDKITDNLLPILVQVKVKEKLKNIKISIGLDSFEGLKTGLVWTNYMFFNNMKKGSLKLEFSKYIQNIGTVFEYPFIIPKYKINFYNNFGYTKENTFVSNNQYIYDEIYLNRKFKNFNINLGFNSIFNNPLDKPYKDNFDLIFSIFENIDFYDVDDLFFPKKGYKINTSIESSFLFSSFNFLELNLGLYGYYPIWQEKNLYISGKLLIDNIKSDENIIQIKKTTGGGYNSNRGYDFDSLTYSKETSSIVKLESSIEIKKEIMNNLYFFLFDDYTAFNEEKYNSIGIGGYYYTPLGVLSVGITNNSEDEQRVFFSVGASF